VSVTSRVAVDTDHDGLSDAYETRYGLNPLVADSASDLDNDGLTNLMEFQLGTAPNDADTDHDGMRDKAEIDNGRDPLVKDNPARTVVIIAPLLLND
jgi:hypothetical protein